MALRCERGGFTALPTYVLNWDEFVQGLLDMADIEANVSIQPLADLLAEYLSRLQEGLIGVLGSQRIKGFALPPSGLPVKSASFTPDADIAITGVTFSQNSFGGTEGFDKWTLSIGINGVFAPILEDMYAKDGLQHKYFEKVYVVPAGAEVKIEVVSTSVATAHWFDLEYLTDLTLPTDTI